MFGRYVGDGERESFYFLQEILSLRFGLEFSLRDREGRVPIYGLQFPIGLGDKVLDFELPIDNQCQCRSLHSSDREYLAVLPIFERVEAGCVHSQQPVADSS